MNEIVYTNNANRQIVSHEDHMLELYMDAIKEYRSIFESNGYSLKVGLMWESIPKNAVSFQRESFRNGYRGYVFCSVQQDNKDVYVSSMDGEADFYPLSATWMVSCIHRKHCKLIVYLFAETNDAAADLREFLSKLKLIN